MVTRTHLSSSAQKAIGKAVERMFERVKGRLLGPEAMKRIGGKEIAFHFIPDLTLGGLFAASSREEGVKPNEDLLGGLMKIANMYLDASKAKAKAKTIMAVQGFLTDARNSGTKTNLETVLGGKLAELHSEVSADVKRILETETNVARNTGLYDAIGRVAAASGREDPTVFFVVVRDGSRCKDCTRLHLLEDETTPRVWKQSELGSGYHKRGDPRPKIAGLHPHCRCSLTHLLPGYGFSAAGMVEYKEPGWDELTHQRG